GFIAPALHLAQHEHPESDHQGEWQERSQQVHPVAAVILYHRDGDAFVQHQLLEIGESRRNRRFEIVAALVLPSNVTRGGVERGPINLSLRYLSIEIGELGRLARGPRVAEGRLYQ